MPTPDRLPSLSVLRCFEAAAKHESFTSAAEELGLTQSAVSRQVKELEDYIGARLFKREGRGIRLNDAGQNLANPLMGDLNRLRRTVQHAIAAGAGPRVLAIAAPPTFAARWLVPRLPRFQENHPNLEMVIYSRPEPFNLQEERIDLAVHFGGWDWPGAQLTPLCPENLLAVCSPALLRRHPVANENDIFEMPLLRLASRPDQWARFGAKLKIDAPRRSGSQFDQFNLLIAAATAGLGAAILPSYLIEEELSDSRLLQLAEVPSETESSYFVATQAGDSRLLTKTFSIWLRKQVTANKHR